jgi:membrane fusion protein, copper/silver efflux system
MKKIVVFSVIVVLIVSIALWVACGRKGPGGETGRQMYQCPMHPDYTSDKPGNCPICGMNLVPVKTVKESGVRPVRAVKKTMFRSSMNPNEVSDKPGKDSMGMEMVPFEMETKSPEAGSVPGLTAVTILPEHREHMRLAFGVVETRSLSRSVRTSARIVADETKLFRTTAKMDGYVEKLFVNATGQAVRRGQPLLSIYSPELVASQQEFLSALAAAEELGRSPEPAMAERGRSLVDAARRRLKLWDISDAQIDQLQKSGKVEKALVLHAPANGYVSEKMVLAGQKIMAGEPLMVVADLSTVWAEVDIYESDLPYVKVGMAAELTFPFWSGKKIGSRIGFLNPFLDAMSRTLKARLEIPNPDLTLKPDMYGEVSLFYDFGQRVVVPEPAVMRTGARNYVFREGGDWSLTPIEVQLGVRGDGYIEVVSGLKTGDRVVTSANFLVDSESSLKAALEAIGRNP